MRFLSTHKCGFHAFVEGFDEEVAQEKADEDHRRAKPNCPGNPDIVEENILELEENPIGPEII